MAHSKRNIADIAGPVVKGPPILDVLREDAEGYRLSDLAAKVGSSPSTTHRLLTALEARRFVQCDRFTSLWHIGSQAF